MAPNLGGLRKGKEKVPPNAAMSPKNAMMNEYVEALYELKKHVEENSDYVGDKFPEEARKIIMVRRILVQSTAKLHPMRQRN